jgi:hypothetical protein
MSQIWDTSGIYHSHLVYYQNENPEGLVCQVLVAAMDSKYGGEGERVARIRPYGYPESDGKDGGHWLKLEDGSSVEEELSSAPLKTWIILQAEGRGESATLKWQEHEANGEITGNGVATTPVTVEEKTITIVPDPVMEPASTTEPFLNSLLQAHSIVQQYKEITGEDLSENVRTLATNLRGHKSNW